jgi:CRP-like cAMP-binding protein
VAPDACANLLLASLPSASRSKLIARCKRVELVFGNVLHEQGDRIHYVYFPLSSFISLISSVGKRSTLEVGLVGTEGMLGVSLLAGVDIAPLRALVQGAGTALRLSAADFSEAVVRIPALRKVLDRYVYVLMSQLAQMAVCSRFHLVEARLARWLLMTRDRAHADTFRLTQEFIAFMLGVRRAGITHAASQLQKRKLIRYTRGNMTILNGRGLESVTCRCYGIACGTYSQLMG